MFGVLVQRYEFLFWCGWAGDGRADDGRTMGFFSLLACLAFGGRMMDGRWAFFSFGGVGFRWVGDGLFALLMGLACSKKCLACRGVEKRKYF